MKIGTAVAGMLLLATVPQGAQANSWCSGTVTASWVDISGNVYIQASWHGTHTQICHLSAEWKGVTPDICASWMAKMDAAVSTGRAVTIYYPGAADCASLPTYTSSPAPNYVMLR